MERHIIAAIVATIFALISVAVMRHDDQKIGRRAPKDVVVPVAALAAIAGYLFVIAIFQTIQSLQ